MQPSKAWIINDTIEKNKRIFKIPVYQRNYDWSNKECQKLYSDIIDAFITQKKHFIGTIVYITGESHGSALTEDLIIDGQQRLTTIMILLKALLDKANETNDSIYSEVNDLLFNRHCDESNKLKLKPIKADDKQFKALMTNNTDFYNMNSNIIRNYNFFKKMINTSLDNGLYLSDILEGMKKLEIVEIVLDKSQGDDPQVIFESINSTGLELSLADKIRNFVLMDDLNQDELFENYWLPLEEKIGKNLADYFITYLDYKVPEKVTKKNAYEIFVKYYKTTFSNHEDILKDLKVYSRYYAAFIGKTNEYGAPINKYLADFRAIDQSTLYVFLFDVFFDFENGKIDNETLLKVLSFFRSYSVRRIICEHPSNSLKGLYKTLYKRLFKDNNGFNKYYETIYSFFKTSTTKDKLILDDEFKESLMHKSLYTKKKMCKFLLSTIENEKSNETLNTDDLSIEHILPQKENAVQWKRMLGDKYAEIYNKYLHTLGNLTITGYNSELGTKSFSEKKEMIKSKSKAKILNKAILEVDSWDNNSIESRAEELANIALEIFKIEEAEVISIEKTHKNNQSYSLDEDIDFAGTTPERFNFYGEEVKINTYSKMLNEMINILYELDSNLMSELAIAKTKVTSSDRCYLSMDHNDLRRAKEIQDSGIYFEANLSTMAILNFIKFLIEKYNMDTDEFSFICEE